MNSKPEPKSGDDHTLYWELTILYAKIAQKAEYDGVPVYTLMETALQKLVAHNA